MYYYFVDKTARENGDHEVHRGGCRECPDDRNRIYIGFFSNCEEALAKASKFFSQVNGCSLCTKEYHSIYF